MTERDRPRATTEHGTMARVILPGVIVAVLLMATVVGHRAGYWTVAELVRDPATHFELPTYAGAVSVIGVMGWVFAAAATGLASAVRRDLRSTLLPVSVLSLWLAIDDQFLLHEHVLPGLGIPEMAVLAIYAIVALWVLRRFLPGILTLRLPTLATAMLCFAASLVVDEFQTYSQFGLLLEDFAKLAGIMFWAGFWTAQSAGMIRSAARRDGIGHR
ncbi:MAG: hypothetical protein Q4G14_05795 [Paracoccus sp. (in: a-proteobacteria)]|uniref:hypothetical protein n=1 Tax=Paracoccus sp. TaxID=267 RepID=UPI0026DF5B5B|nr:hypothetical protein [Paracoccus sp. (in: a-proteobacteria)]MDO5612742.1 hypothetical protein [Paracoccus sp. (in: a-proteobacteria)]